MSKILAIDYGTKRCGFAITDSLQIIASALETVETKMVQAYLKELLRKEEIECIVIGEAKRLHGEASEVESRIIPFIGFLKNNFPAVKIERQDERFTSKLALDSMIRGGASKKQRREKGTLDKVSATLILQAYLEKIKH